MSYIKQTIISTFIGSTILLNQSNASAFQLENITPENANCVVQYYANKIRTPYNLLAYENGSPAIKNEKIEIYISKGNLELIRPSLESYLSKQLKRQVKLSIKTVYPTENNN